MLTNKIKIGTSGFSYKDWLGNFYPQFIPPKDFLFFYSKQLPVVELDVTFYRIPTAQMIDRWISVTPDNFRFAAKFPQIVTHEGSIEQRIENARLFIDVMRPMKEKLGPLLLQFPYSFKPESWPLLEKLIACLPDDLKFAVEIRNKSWLSDKLFDFLSSRNIALCQIEHAWMPRISKTTADFMYLRFLGDRKQISDDYSYIRIERDSELDWWSNLVNEKSSQMTDIYSFFNNHFSGHAPTTADKFKNLIIDTDNQ